MSLPIGRYTPFAHALLGVAHENSGGGLSDTSFGDAIGGGLDYKIVKAWPRVYRSTYFRPGSTAEIKTTSGPLGRWRHCDSVLKSRGGDSDEEDWVSLEAAFAKWRQIAM